MGAEDFVKLSVRAYIELAQANISVRAELAFYRGLQYCGGNNTHGVIVAGHMPILGPRSAADELVAAGVWQKMPNGWCFTSWDKWQTELEQLQEKRTKDAKRKREERRASRAKTLGLVEDVSDAS